MNAALQPDPAGLYYESRISSALGVPRKILAGLRKDHLVEKKDFVRLENNLVALTAAGLARIENLLAHPPSAGDGGLLNGKPAANAGKPSSDIPLGPPAREKMRVEKVPQNPGILMCARSNPPSIVMIRVRDNTNFVPGMMIEAIQAGDGFWQFRNRSPGEESTCGRLPRMKGRW